MFDTLRNLVGLGKEINYAELLAAGAQIIDVRTPEEYRSGHINGSVNIPLQRLSGEMSRIKKDRPVITCCASGMRSATAKNILLSHGFSDVHNGGGWMGLQGKLAR